MPALAGIPAVWYDSDRWLGGFPAGEAAAEGAAGQTERKQRMERKLTLPAKGANIEVILDIILQVVNVINAIGRLLFGPNFTIFGGN